MSILSYSDIFAICIEIADFAQLQALWLDESGCLLKVNDRLKHVLGYSDSETFPHSDIFSLIPTLTPSDWQETWQEIQTESGYVFQAQTLSKDGTEHAVTLHCKSWKLNGIQTAFCWLGTSASDQQKEDTQQQLLETSAFATDQAQLMIYRLHFDGTFFIFNEIMRQKLGYTAEELREVHLSTLFQKDKTQDFEKMWHALQRGESVHGEAWVAGKNGILFPIEYFMTTFRKDPKDGFCGIWTDISERKQKEEELQRAFDEIQELKEQLEAENQVLQEEIKLDYNFNHIVSNSPTYRKVLKQIEQVADTDTTVLLLGETGTGKELLARAIHQLSRRADRPIVKANCSALSPHLLEGELFGYEKGAFAGAYQQRKGRFEMAHQGTIFLDEIAELPLDLQSKLLRVLQEGEFERMGGTETIRVDVRVVAASNRNLEKLMQEGKLRKDLYYQLRVFPIYNIPLRERREDIPLLVRHFVEKYAYKIGKPITSIPQKALEQLMEYPFPGNIRELENIIERAVILSTSTTLHLEMPLIETIIPVIRLDTFKTMEQIQREHILNALRGSNGQVSGETGAAKLLDMNDKTLYSKMKKLGIERQDYLSEHNQ